MMGIAKRLRWLPSLFYHMSNQKSIYIYIVMLCLHLLRIGTTDEH
jgi:hypothetical protein